MKITNSFTTANADGGTFMPTSDSVRLMQSDKHVIYPGAEKQAKLYAKVHITKVIN